MSKRYGFPSFISIVDGHISYLMTVNKVMMQLETEDEWAAYVLAVKESEWKCLEVLAVKQETLNLGGCFDLNACLADDVVVTPSGGNNVPEVSLARGCSEHLQPHGFVECEHIQMVPVEVVKQQYLESGSALNDVVDEEMN